MLSFRTVLISLAAAALLSGCKGKGLEDLRTEGDTRMSTGQFAQAADLYQQYVDRNPGNPYIRAAAGKAYLKAGKPNEAAYHLRVAISQRPQDVDTLNDLCEALFQSGQRDELFRTLRGSTADAGTVADYVRLGKYSQAMGDSDSARTALLTAALIDKGKTVEPQLALCDYHAALGDTVAAERRLRMAFYISPENTEVLRRMRSMKVITGPTFPLRPEEMAEPVAPATPAPGSAGEGN